MRQKKTIAVTIGDQRPCFNPESMSHFTISGSTNESSVAKTNAVTFSNCILQCGRSSCWNHRHSPRSLFDYLGHHAQLFRRPKSVGDQLIQHEGGLRCGEKPVEEECNSGAARPKITADSRARFAGECHSPLSIQLEMQDAGQELARPSLRHKRVSAECSQIGV